MTTVKLDHPTDPRYLLVEGPLPKAILLIDLEEQRYGKPLIVAPPTAVVTYTQPGGPATPWLRPESYAESLEDVAPVDRLRDADDDSGYAPTDPKHPSYHDRMSWHADDMRKRAKGE